jgi:hypothetical protein
LEAWDLIKDFFTLKDLCLFFFRADFRIKFFVIEGVIPDGMAMLMPFFKKFKIAITLQLLSHSKKSRFCIVGFE